MTFHFPLTPTVGQQVLADNGVLYEWDSVKWIVPPGSYLPLTGGTLTGALTLHDDPVLALEAATKQYVDAEIATAASDLTTALGGDFLPLTGGTLSGPGGANGALTFDKPTGGSGANWINAVNGTTGGQMRWQVLLGGDLPETGANIGSQFAIRRYSDAGVNLGDALTIARESGTVDIWNIRNGSIRVDTNFTAIATAVVTFAPRIACNGSAQFGTVNANADQFNNHVVRSGYTSYIRSVFSPDGFSNQERWRIYLNDGASDVGDSGSNFRIDRYTNTGVTATPALTIRRSDGVVSIGAPTGSAVTVPSSVNIAGGYYVNGVKVGMSVIVADAPPTDVPPNALWMDSTSGAVYIWLNGAQWVGLTPPQTMAA